MVRKGKDLFCSNSIFCKSEFFSLALRDYIVGAALDIVLKTEDACTKVDA